MRVYFWGLYSAEYSRKTLCRPAFATRSFLVLWYRAACLLPSSYGETLGARPSTQTQMREGRPCQSPTTNGNRFVHVTSVHVLGAYSTHPRLLNGMAFPKGLASMTSRPEPSGGDCRDPAHTNAGFKGVCSLSSHQAQMVNPVRATLTLAGSQTGCREARVRIIYIQSNLSPTTGSFRGSTGTARDSPCHPELDVGPGNLWEPTGG